MREYVSNIVILSDQTVRARIIRKIIMNDLHKKVKVSVLKASQVSDIRHKAFDPLVLLIDLMGIDNSPKQIIGKVKELDAGIKIIALHLYRSSNLVSPLFNMGIDGYIYYEPSREEIITAILTVISGKQYVPNFLVPA